MKRSKFEEIQRKLNYNEPVSLRDVLHISNPAIDTFAVGANSAFVFMGTVDDFYMDLPYLEKYYKEFYRKYRDKVYRDFCIKKYQESIFKQMGVIFEVCLDDIPDDFIESIQKDFKKELKHRGIPDDFVSLLDRQVKEFYIKRMPGEPKFAVIIKGVESGKCWLIKEYPKALDDIKRMVFKSGKFSPINP